MTREDIVGALQSAIARGYPLRSAMQSLFNAGYSKLEIEEAARTMNNPETPSMPSLAAASPVEKKVVQRASDYSKPSSSGNLFVYVLVGILILLIAGLVATLMFKEQVIGFIRGLTG
jgi:hypothetical protein